MFVRSAVADWNSGSSINDQHLKNTVVHIAVMGVSIVDGRDALPISSGSADGEQQLRKSKKKKTKFFKTSVWNNYCKCLCGTNTENAENVELESRQKHVFLVCKEGFTAEFHSNMWASFS